MRRTQRSGRFRPGLLDRAEAIQLTRVRVRTGAIARGSSGNRSGRGASAAIRPPRRHWHRRARDRRARPGPHSAERGLVRARRRRLRATIGWRGAPAVGLRAVLAEGAADRGSPPARPGPTAGSGSARPQSVHAVSGRPAHGHLRRLRGRQVHPARDAGAPQRCRCPGARADRRAGSRARRLSPRGARAGGSRPVGGRGRDLGSARDGAAARRLPRAHGGGGVARPWPAGPVPVRQPDAVRHGVARDPSRCR
jgi:hypothetical protein